MAKPTVSAINGASVVSLPGFFSNVISAIPDPTTQADANAIWVAIQAEMAILGLNIDSGVIPLLVKPDEKLAIHGANFNQAGNTAEARLTGVTVAFREHDALRVVKNSAPTATDFSVYVPSLAELQTTKVQDHPLISVPNLNLSLNLNYQYQRNAILMPMLLHVSNPTGASSSEDGADILLGVVLPPPSVGVPNLKNGLVTVGNPHGSAGDKTDNFGRLTMEPGMNSDTHPGDVRWYGLDMLGDFNYNDPLSYLPDLSVGGIEDQAKALWSTLFQMSVQGFSQLASLTSGSIQSTGILPFLSQEWSDLLGYLATIHKKGKGQPDGVAIQAWDDDGASFKLPSDTDFGSAGLAVIWRDDLPSAPMPLCNLEFDCSDPKQHDDIENLLVEAANALWSFAPTTDLTFPMVPGLTVDCALTAVADETNNLLAKLKISQNIDLSVTIHFDGLDADESKATKIDGDTPFTTKDKQNYHVLPKPNLLYNSQQGDGVKSMTVQAMVDVSVNGCAFTDIPFSPKFNISVRPINIPTFAIFFSDVDFGGIPLLVFPASEPVRPFPSNLLPPGALPDISLALPSGLHWDMTGVYDAAGNPCPDAIGSSPWNTLDTLRHTIFDFISTADAVVSVLKVFYTADWVETVKALADQIKAVTQMVLDTTGNLGNLTNSVVNTHSILGFFGWTDNFNDSLDSVIIVGPPSSVSKVYFHCYQDENSGGDELTLSIQDKQYIGALPKFSDVNSRTPGEIDFAGKTLKIPLPRVEASPATRADFHDMISSIVVEQQ